MCRCSTPLAASALLFCLIASVSAQHAVAPPSEGTPQAPPRDDARAQYPALLSHAFASLNVGYISYPFSDLQLEQGYHVESVHVPHVAVRAVLVGRRFGEYVSAQASYIVASYVGVTRLQNLHYLSDVTFGAALGVAAGLAVNLPDRRAAIVPIVAPGVTGVKVGINLSRPTAH